MADIVRTAADRVGGVPELARRLGISRQAIYRWKAVPVDKVDAVARITGLNKNELRPDIYKKEVKEINAKESVAVPYMEDYVAWSYGQAQALRKRQFDVLDCDHLVEEIEHMAQSHKDEIESRMNELLKHLLKWKFQPDERSNAWKAMILEQRARIARRIARSPSLRSHPAKVLGQEYALARREAAIEAGLSLERLPTMPPFDVEEVLDLDFLPGPADAT